jgi:hypothetical protein
VRRIISVLAVAALMAAMMVTMAMPAFAKGNPTGKENPHAVFEDDGSIEVRQQCAPGVGGCEPPGSGKDAQFGNPGWDSNFDVCPGTGRNTQDC